jgi:hypothetical protein
MKAASIAAGTIGGDSDGLRSPSEPPITAARAAGRGRCRAAATALRPPTSIAGERQGRGATRALHVPRRRDRRDRDAALGPAPKARRQSGTTGTMTGARDTALAPPTPSSQCWPTVRASAPRQVDDGCLLPPRRSCASARMARRRRGGAGGFRRRAFDDPLEEMTARVDEVERMLNRLSEEWQSAGDR